MALTFTGDGASSAGLFHETLNMAAVFNAPLVVIVENNLYAYSTPLEQQMKVPDIACRAEAYGIPGVAVDGNQVEAVYAVVGEAVERARTGGGPTLIEAKTMRMQGHAIHDGFEYVPRELLALWEERDPVRLYAQKLLNDGVAGDEELAAIRARCEAEVAAALAVCRGEPAAGARDSDGKGIRAMTTAAANTSASATGSNFGFGGIDEAAGDRTLTYIAAISEALREEMRRDPERAADGRGHRRQLWRRLQGHQGL